MIGEEYDPSSGLHYLNARYYDGGRGRFTGQDPVFRAVGDAETVKMLAKRELEGILMDPQALNSYAYGRGNPVLLADPTGRMFDIPLISNSPWVQEGAIALYDQSSAWRWAMDHPWVPAAVGAAPLAIYGAVVAVPAVGSAIATAAASPVVQAAAGRGLIGAGASISTQVLSDQAAGVKTSGGSVAASGASGFVAGATGLKAGLVGSVLLGMGSNSFTQLYNNGWNPGQVNYTSVAISAMSSALTHGTISSIPSGTAGKGIAEAVFNWVSETAGQVINSGLRTAK